jgi:hypothetical protein
VAPYYLWVGARVALHNCKTDKVEVLNASAHTRDSWSGDGANRRAYGKDVKILGPVRAFLVVVA